MKPVYKIKDSKKNPLETVFKKSNFEVELTLGEFKQAKEGYEKKVKEIESQIGLEKAKMVNVEKNHPHVLKMEKEPRVAVMVYTTAEMKVNEMETLLADMAKNYKLFEEEMEEIKKQIGLSIEEPIVEEAKEVIKKDE